MKTPWTNKADILKEPPFVLWMLLNALLTAMIGPNILGWTVIAAVAFMIYPKLWDGPEKSGLGPSASSILAALFVMGLAYGAWTHLGAPELHTGTEAKAVVSASLRDPSSAEFRNIIAGANATCGEVNGKNAFGAYVGFKPFVYADGIVRIEPEQPILSDVQSQTTYYQEVAEFARTKRRCYE